MNDIVKRIAYQLGIEKLDLQITINTLKHFCRVYGINKSVQDIIDNITDEFYVEQGYIYIHDTEEDNDISKWTIYYAINTVYSTDKLYTPTDTLTLLNDKYNTCKQINRYAISMHLHRLAIDSAIVKVTDKKHNRVYYGLSDVEDIIWCLSGFENVVGKLYLCNGLSDLYPELLVFVEG